MNLRIGITGGTGLVGRALRSKISKAVTLIMRNHPEDLINSNEKIILGSFSDPAVIEGFTDSINVLIHTATSVGPRSEYEESFVRDDLVGTLKLAKAFFQKQPFGHFIYLSTSGGLYDLNDLKIKTEISELYPERIYGAVKLIVEESLERICGNEGKVTILRPAAIYGDLFKKNQDVGLIDKLLKSTLFDVPVPLFDNMDSARDYLHVEDLVLAIIAVIDRKKGERYEIYNVGTGEETSIKNVLKAINLLGDNKVKTNITFSPKQRTSLIVNSDKILRDIGWSAKLSLHDGLLKMYKSFKNEE